MCVQVAASFVSFDVKLPDILESSVRYLHAISSLITLDVFIWPGVGCLVEMDWGIRLFLRVTLPLAVVALMCLPVVVSWVQLRYVEERASVERCALEDSDDKCVEMDGGEPAHTRALNVVAELRNVQRRVLMAREKLEKTKNVCWYNTLSWMFLVFPTVTLASMEAFR